MHMTNLLGSQAHNLTLTLTVQIQSCICRDRCHSTQQHDFFLWVLHWGDIRVAMWMAYL